MVEKAQESIKHEKLRSPDPSQEPYLLLSSQINLKHIGTNLAVACNHLVHLIPNEA